jgi:hypothetical protein
VSPVVAEVVAVHHLRPLSPGHLRERGGGLVLPFGPVVIVVRRAELATHRLEGVQVIVIPAEGDLQDPVHQVQRHRAGNLEPAPDRRLRAVQAHLDLVHGSEGVLREFGQFLPRYALAANERLLFDAALYLLLQRLARAARQLEQQPLEFVECHWLFWHSASLPDASSTYYSAAEAWGDHLTAYES